MNDHLGLGIEFGLLEIERFVKQSNPPINGRTDRFELIIRGNYFLNSESPAKPYAGIGAGIASFFHEDGEFVGNTLVYSSENQFRLVMKPEIGLRIKWFNLGIAYNFISKYDSPWSDDTLNLSAFELTLGGYIALGKN